MSKEGRPSFLQKRSKKPLSPRICTSRATPDAPEYLSVGKQEFFASFLQKRKPFFLLFLLATNANAETVQPPDISPPDTWVPRQAGILRVLNKLDSTVTTLTFKLGETRTLQTLSITLKACAVRPQDLPQDATAQLSVTDSREGAPGFQGWILANEPAASMLEHPVYDIQLAGCA